MRGINELFIDGYNVAKCKLHTTDASNINKRLTLLSETYTVHTSIR